MNQINYVRLIASAIFATAASGMAATADFNGQNGWVQYGGAYGGTVTTITATTDQHASGNASMVFDVADGNGLSYPDAAFTPTTGGTVTVSMNMYFPSTSQGSFLFGFDDGVGGYYNGWYVTDSLGDWRDRWVAMKFVINLDSSAPGNGTYYFDDMVTPAGTFDYGSNTINNVWFLVGNGFNGGTVSGPFYFDDMEVTQGSTTIWSDNFDSYVVASDPNLISLDVVTNGSVAVSGNVAGGLPGQGGLWNELPLDGGQISLSSLTNGAGTSAGGVGFVFDSASVGYHVQGGDSPYNPGVVLAADNPERSWVTGGETPVTFKFTGLTVGGNYQVAIFTTGDPLMTLTVNGASTLDPGEIFTATTTGNSSGEIVCQVSCGGSAYDGYAEIAGVQLLKLTTPPPLAAQAGADKALSPSTPSAALGGSPSASGGTGPYTYAWSPSTGLDDATLANPTVTTTDATTTYTLTVTDSLLATATDTVVVTYTVTALVANAGADKNVSPGSPAVIGGSPSASGGNCTYFYSWAPSTGLDDATLANPTASPTVTTTYTLTVTDSLSTPEATDSVVVTYVPPASPNPNLISVDFTEGGIPCSGDTILTGTTMNNAAGISFSGQSGSWNSLNIGTYNSGSATTGFLNNGAGAATTVKMALGSATGLSDPGYWRCSPNEGAAGGANQLRDETAYIYYPTLTANHFVWAFTGLTPNAHYQLVLFANGNSNYTNIANSVAGVLDAEGDWNWSDIQADGAGVIAGNLLYTQSSNNNSGLFGAQIEAIGAPPSGYSTWATTYAGGQTPGEDFNHDGVQNGIAYFMGMNGLATNPGVVSGKVTWPNGGNIPSSAYGTQFVVQTSTDLVNWTNVLVGDPNLNNTSGSVSYTLPTGDAKEFCRLVVTP